MLCPETRSKLPFHRISEEREGPDHCTTGHPDSNLPTSRGCRALQKLFTSWYSSPVAVVIHSFPNFTRASLTNRLSAKLPRSRVCTHVTTVCASTCVMCLFGWRRYTWTFPFPPPLPSKEISAWIYIQLINTQRLEKIRTANRKRGRIILKKAT